MMYVLANSHAYPAWLHSSVKRMEHTNLSFNVDVPWYTYKLGWRIIRAAMSLQDITSLGHLSAIKVIAV